ncbi:MAG: hypothetical protein AAGE05_14990 [Pseudomonadota bacterium]
MNPALGPIARRYWFADAAALEAVRRAEDPPRWDAGSLPVTAFCLDTETLDALQSLAEDDGSLHIVDARDPVAFGARFADELESERAAYLQFAFHAVEDFGPSLDFMMARLEKDAPEALGSQMLAVSRYATEMPSDTDDIDSETIWIAAKRVRDLPSSDAPESLRSAIEIIVRQMPCERLPLVTGAFYRVPWEELEPEAASRETALWRARAARAWTEVERLRSEKRARSSREAALSARYKRDLARQADRSRGEIDRLHRAAGWAGRWRARLARLSGRR